ncbi:hypothetical protein [Lactiplantibacillus modestisalitolerans]|uniref:Uncharacterized protein n=1 Tax=Lactiplantibacillus modestisalitolerans TaxID=1457219 RepID=A0ABV5WRP8_9LACO
MEKGVGLARNGESRANYEFHYFGGVNEKILGCVIVNRENLNCYDAIIPSWYEEFVNEPFRCREKSPK